MSAQNNFPTAEPAELCPRWGHIFTTTEANGPEAAETEGCCYPTYCRFTLWHCFALLSSVQYGTHTHRCRQASYSEVNRWFTLLIYFQWIDQRQYLMITAVSNGKMCQEDIISWRNNVEDPIGPIFALYNIWKNTSNIYHLTWSWRPDNFKWVSDESHLNFFFFFFF